MSAVELRDAIRPGEFLRLEEFKARTGQGPAAWHSVRRYCLKNGIPIEARVGKQTFVSTDGWLAYLRTKMSGGAK